MWHISASHSCACSALAEKLHCCSRLLWRRRPTATRPACCGEGSQSSCNTCWPPSPPSCRSSCQVSLLSFPTDHNSAEACARCKCLCWPPSPPLCWGSCQVGPTLSQDASSHGESPTGHSHHGANFRVLSELPPNKSNVHSWLGSIVSASGWVPADRAGGLRPRRHKRDPHAAAAGRPKAPEVDPAGNMLCADQVQSHADHQGD